MVECQAKARKWGNSIGVVLPVDIIESEHIKEDDQVHMIIINKDRTAARLFGRFKGRWKKSAQQIKDELREELYDD